jgi:hypothetical protein
MAVGSGWDVPAEQVPWTEFSWFKVKGSRSLVLVVLSDMPVWYTGHYWKGRMTPCLGADCEACSNQIGAQLRYVIGAVEYSTKRVGLLEISRSIAQELKEMMGRDESMKGMAIEFTKYSNAKNSRMIVTEVTFANGLTLSDYHCPDILNALVATWEKAGIQIPDELRDRAKHPYKRAQERSSNAKCAPQGESDSTFKGKERWRQQAADLAAKKRVL